MSSNRNYIVKSSDSQSTDQSINRSRRALAKGTLVAPILMTLNSRQVLGETPYHCTVSGAASGNQSPPHDNTTPCNLGFSPGAWKTPGYSGDGSLSQWKKTGCSPYTTSSSTPNAVTGVFTENSTATTKKNDEKTFGNLKAKKAYEILGSTTIAATVFNDIFGGNDTRTLHEILMNSSGSLEFHVVADFLNAKLNQAVPGKFSPVYDQITPQYIINVYNNSSLTADQKKDYFIMIHH